MATEGPVNGNYAPHQGYGGLEHQQNNYGYAATSTTPSQPAAATQPPPASTTPAATSSSAAQPDISKDEVGWYFVEQYYTTLSRNPDKLYLFYQKRSQFVSGQETDKVNVCVGQRAIHERIKELEFKECKVRVTNVDSQSSDSNIVIQVIGEISNKSQPHRKFVQTFVLATQPTGYFVLNDIFRYLIDEEEEPEQTVEPAKEELQQAPAAESGYQEPVPTRAEVEPKGLTGSDDATAVERDAQKVDQEIESRIPTEQHVEPAAPTVNGTSAPQKEPQQTEEAAVAVPAVEPAVTETVAPTVEETNPEPEKPAAETTATPAPPKQEAAQPAAPAKPAAPATWASLAARANKVATPATPSTASSNTSQSKPAPKPAASATSAAVAPAPTPAQASSSTPTASAAQRDASPAEGNDEWTAVGGSHNRNQSRQVNNQPETPAFRGYVGNVRENIDGNELRAVLAKFDEILYFDIAHQKSCAFVDFKTAEGFQAAKDASPHIVNGEELKLEDRKFKPGATPYVPRGQYQGRGRGGAPGGPRGNYQSQRGAYAQRGRGGPGGTPRGRGSSIAT